MAQPPKWNLDNYNAYIERRNTLVANYTNNMEVVKTRTIPAALDYPNANKEVEAAKEKVLTAIHGLSAENETLTGFLKQLQSQMGPEVLKTIMQEEKKLEKLLKENAEMEHTMNLRTEQAKSGQTKYDSNQHVSLFSYMPWEVQFSKWYSFSPTNPYIDLNPGARSVLLIISCIFGLSALIITGVYIYLFAKENNIQIPGLATGMFTQGRGQPVVPTPFVAALKAGVKAALPSAHTQRIQRNLK